MREDPEGLKSATWEEEARARQRALETDMSMKVVRCVDNTTLQSPQASVSSATKAVQHTKWPLRYVPRA
jgi:hypothetical protein